jgi:hypothetical protein
MPLLKGRGRFAPDQERITAGNAPGEKPLATTATAAAETMQQYQARQSAPLERG